MSIMLEVLEWMDPTGTEMIYRIPQQGSADLKLGAQVIVRDSQLCVFFKDGHAADSFATGRHTLSTLNIPILTRLLSLPWGFTSPFRAEVYFVNLKNFVNQKWGTKDPVTFRDSKLGFVRLRGYGVYSMRIAEPMLFLNTIVGRQSVYTTADIHDYLRNVIVARLNDLMGEKLDSILDLPKQYTELASQLATIVSAEFRKCGLELQDFYISAITPPDEVGQMIDQRSGLEAVGDVDKFLKYEMARGMGAPGGPGAVGSMMGMAGGVGVLMPAMMSKVFSPEQKELSRESIPTVTCPKCHTDTPEQSRYCYRCGHAMMTQNICSACQHELPTEAAYCLHCGFKLDSKVQCPHCSATLIPGSRYCGNCGKQANGNSAQTT